MIVSGLRRAASTRRSRSWPSDQRAPAPARLGARLPWKRSSGIGPLWQSRQSPTVRLATIGASTRGIARLAGQRLGHRIRTIAQGALLRREAIDGQQDSAMASARLIRSLRGDRAEPAWPRPRALLHAQGASASSGLVPPRARARRAAGPSRGDRRSAIDEAVVRRRQAVAGVDRAAARSGARPASRATIAAAQTLPCAAAGEGGLGHGAHHAGIAQHVDAGLQRRFERRPARPGTSRCGRRRRPLGDGRGLLRRDDVGDGGLVLLEVGHDGDAWRDRPTRRCRPG